MKGQGSGNGVGLDLSIVDDASFFVLLGTFFADENRTRSKKDMTNPSDETMTIIYPWIYKILFFSGITDLLANAFPRPHG